MMTIFIVMELIAIYFSGGFIDYQFYVNLNINDIIEGLFIFKLQALLTVIVFFGLIFSLLKLTTFFQKKLNNIVRLVILIIAVLSLNYNNGPIDKLVEIYRVVSAPQMTFQEALDNMAITHYPTKNEITAIPGKNIIIISLESFEKGFLAFKNVTPNLNQLCQKYTLYPNMPMSTGSSWTTASMYTYMTGMPLLVSGINTMPLNDISQTKLISLADVLHKAGYQTRYIIGSPTFAGIGHIISLFDIEIISEKSYPDEYPEAPFGLYDKDIFDIAKRQVDELAKNEQPFSLFISTISTHAPNGFYDQRMENIIDKNLDNMSFVAASLDYNLSEFINHLEKQGLLENTVFYIFPDHLMMGSGTETIFRLSENERLLYLLTNANQSDLPYQSDSTVYQIDLPRFILDGAKVKSNALFLTDYLNKEIDKKQFIEQHKSDIATLNRAAGM